MIHWSNKKISGETDHWEGRVVKKNGAITVELRKTFAKNPNYGQVLIVIGDPFPKPDSRWIGHPHKATSGIRFSANGTVEMTIKEFDDMRDAIKLAQTELKGVSSGD